MDHEKISQAIPEIVDRILSPAIGGGIQPQQFAKHLASDIELEVRAEPNDERATAYLLALSAAIELYAENELGLAFADPDSEPDQPEAET